MVYEAELVLDLRIKWKPNTEFYAPIDLSPENISLDIKLEAGGVFSRQITQPYRFFSIELYMLGDGRGL
jgi:hypothetical protein